MAKRDPADKPSAPVTNMMSAMQDSGMKALSDFGPEWFNTMNTIGSEMMTFMSKRVVEDVQTQHALLHAKDFAEVQKIQSDFVTRAMQDYTTEMTKLMGLDTTPKRHATPI